LVEYEKKNVLQQRQQIIFPCKLLQKQASLQPEHQQIIISDGI